MVVKKKDILPMKWEKGVGKKKIRESDSNQKVQQQEKFNEGLGNQVEEI